MPRGGRNMDRESSVLDYERPPAAPVTSARRATGWLLGVFLLYAAANVLLVRRAFASAEPPWDVLIAFAIPLPLIFVAVAVLAHFLASPPLFNGWVLLAVVLLVSAAALMNFYVLGEASASV